MITYYHLQMTFIPSLDERGKFFIWVTRPNGEPISISKSRLHWLIGESSLSHVFTSEKEDTKTLMIEWDDEFYEVEGLLVDMWRVYLYLQNPIAHTAVGSFYFGESFVYWESIARSLNLLIREGQYYPTIYAIMKEKRHYVYGQWMLSRKALDQGTFSNWLKTASPLIFSLEHLATVPIREWQDLMLDLWMDQLLKVLLSSGGEIEWQDQNNMDADLVKKWERSLVSTDVGFFSVVEEKPKLQKVHVLIREVRKWHASLSSDTYRKLEKGLINFKQQFIQIGLTPESLIIECSPPSNVHSNNWSIRIDLIGKDKDTSVRLPIDDPKVIRSHMSKWVNDHLEYVVQMDDALYKTHSRLKNDGESQISVQTLQVLHQNLNLLKSMDIQVSLPQGWTFNSIDKEDVHVTLHVNNNQDYGIGLSSILDFDWKITIGDIELSIAEFKNHVEKQKFVIKKDHEWIMLPQAKMEEIYEEMIDLEPLVRKKSSFASLVGVQTNIQEQDASIDIQMDDHIEDYLAHFLSPIQKEYPIPKEFNGVLRPYQEKGYRWMQSHRDKQIGVCLADDMGLGKTIQAITYLLASGQEKGPHLIICPTSVLGNWKREFGRFSPSLHVFIHHGAERTKDVTEFQKMLDEQDVVITSYALMLRDAFLFQSVHWNTLILDEAQMIKNPTTKQSRTVRLLKSAHRIALTGTPMENRLEELWSISDFLNPGYLGNRSSFNEQFIRPIEKEGKTERIQILKQLIQPFLLRRSKAQTSIVDELPEKSEEKVYCSLTKEQAALYQTVVDQLREKLSKADGMERRGTILGGITKLKQVCNHPALLTYDEPKTVHSGKAVELLNILNNEVGAKEKVLLFTQYVKMGELVERILKDTDEVSTVFFLHGGVPSHKREQILEKFKETQAKKCVFILSIKAGGVGLNLTEANHVIHLDRWWNPAVENQATDRAYRIGQQQNVRVYKMITKGTLEEGIDRLIDRKSQLTSQVVSHQDQWVTELSDNELIELIQLRERVLSS